MRTSAERDYKEVIRIAPKNQEAYLFLGTLYAKRGDYEQGRKVFEQLIALDPQSFLGYYYAGRTMLAAGNYSAAERYYNKALDLNPQSELALLDLAALREDQGRRDDAVAIYKKILQINPNDDRAHKRLAELYFAAHASAEGPVKPAPPPEKIDISPSDTRTKIGLLYFERGDFDRAATEFNLVLGAEPDNYRVHYYLGTAYSELTDYREGGEGV